eukprot:2689970-Prymnesium_polylepis.3
MTISTLNHICLLHSQRRENEAERLSRKTNIVRPRPSKRQPRRVKSGGATDRRATAEHVQSSYSTYSFHCGAALTLKKACPSL